MKVETLKDPLPDGGTEVVATLDAREAVLLMLRGRVSRKLGRTTVTVEVEGTPADARLARILERSVSDVEERT